ncbi:helix-turn-helix domain-containing protein [Phocaeicola plebeius]|jgi:transcriptional regulator with XRE-family HTH domain|uniref:helix-turn-helix domain-containing protein n=1 Tax=Phocaeicola plebeius TaxID=310297 RepID=UPI00189A6FBC|nr:helix-turn-helix transcriptional regulator [Phocaeicola plebeius]
MKKNSLFEARKKSVSNEARDFVDLSFKIVDRIHEILKDKNLSQKDLALLLGKNEAEISKWMRGTHNFTLATLVKLEKALGCPIISVVDSKSDSKDFVLYNFLTMKSFQTNAVSKSRKKSEYNKEYSLMFYN